MTLNCSHLESHKVASPKMIKNMRKEEKVEGFRKRRGIMKLIVERIKTEKGGFCNLSTESKNCNVK